MVIRQDMVNENDEPRASPVKVQEGVAGGELPGGPVAPKNGGCRELSVLANGTRGEQVAGDRRTPAQ